MIHRYRNNTETKRKIITQQETSYFLKVSKHIGRYGCEPVNSWADKIGKEGIEVQVKHRLAYLVFPGWG